MKLTIKRGPTTRREVAGASGDVTTSSDEVIEVPGKKIFAFLSGSAGTGALLASLILYWVRDQPAAEHERAIREQCLQVQIVAVALQADSPDARRAGLRLLKAIGSLTVPTDSVDALIADSEFVLPRWTTTGRLTGCSTDQADGAIRGQSASTGNASDAADSPATPQ